MAQELAVTINKVLIPRCRLPLVVALYLSSLLTYSGKSSIYLIGAGTGSGVTHFFTVDFEGMFSACPIFHAMPVMLYRLETVRLNNTMPCGVFNVGVLST